MHLVADIPALILIAGVLGVLTRMEDGRRNAVTT
jgi:hypothetical protein